MKTSKNINRLTRIKFGYLSNVLLDTSMALPRGNSFGYYRRMSEIEFELKNYKNAYGYLLKNIELFEKNNNAEKTSDLIKTEESNVKKQKQLEIDLANEQKANEVKIKNISFIALGISFLLICGIVFSLVKINKSKKTISLQKNETEKQKHLVDEKQKEIIESITYVKCLQEAILPPQAFIDEHIKENFILYKPKDLVAGDFYWAHFSPSPLGRAGEGTFFIAAADSTGHGVPGAMVSVVCSNALNRTIKEFKETEPGKILDKTRELVIETFEKSTSEVKDGMDISLLCIDSKNKTISWSGAHNSLWYISESESSRLSVRAESRTDSKELVEIKADKQPIGKTEYPKPFTTHQIEYKEGTTFYLFTDGFADQFGGPNGKKYMAKNFKQVLVANSHLPFSKQKEVLEQTFQNWVGDLEQVDDVCVVGIRI